MVTYSWIVDIGPGGFLITRETRSSIQKFLVCRDYAHKSVQSIGLALAKVNSLLDISSEVAGRQVLTVDVVVEDEADPTRAPKPIRVPLALAVLLPKAADAWTCTTNPALPYAARLPDPSFTTILWVPAGNVDAAEELETKEAELIPSESEIEATAGAADAILFSSRRGKA